MASTGPPQKEMPEQDEFVIATVKKIMPYGAFCTLDEYGGQEAFIHVSEVASRWVKNIHEFLKEGQKVVARVHRLTPEKNQIDLSLRRVSDADRKLKLESWRREKRANKLFELCAKRMRMEPGTAWRSVGAELLKGHEDMYSALEDISFNGEKAFKGLEVSAGWRAVLLEVARQNIKRPEVRITGTLTIRSFAADGIKHVKKALLAAKEAVPAMGEISLYYLGAPKYMLSVKAPDYKSAEKALEMVQASIAKALGENGSVSFAREAS